jgi:hypothetical protein
MNDIEIQKCKARIIENLDEIKTHINAVLNAENLSSIEPILKRIDSTGHLPLWFSTLLNEKRLPNLDGKTVGSVIEKLLVCVLEKYVFNDEIQLSVNPAKGVDIPELELGIKSPSTNFCTSEPYFSAYERLLGNEYDAMVLLTNYQEAKGKSPFKLQIIEVKYLRGTEIADVKLCNLARLIREKYKDEVLQKKMARFLSYVNQSDWEASCLLKLIEDVLIGGKSISSELKAIEKQFKSRNNKLQKEGKPLLEDDSLERLLQIKEFSPIHQGIVNACDNWVIINQKDNGRFPNDNEWHRFIKSPLDGKIGMSFALQWRYNFGVLFNHEK